MKEIKLTKEFLLERKPEYKILEGLYNNDRTELVEDLFELMESEFDQNLSEYIFDIFSSLEPYFIDCWDNWITQEIVDRKRHNKSINPKNIIIGLHECPPKKNGQKVMDILADRLKTILDLNYSNCPDELFYWMDEYCGTPPEWVDEINKSHLIDELKDFTDTKAILEIVNEVDFNQQEVKEILIELAENGKANTDLEAFLEIIDTTKPGDNYFRPYYKEYISDIINAGNWNDDEWETITERFSNVNFEMPYGDLNRESIRQEIEHIKKMTAINPNYRHD